MTNAVLTARRKADRAIMADRVVDLASACQVAAWHRPERSGTRLTLVDVQGPHKLRLTVKFDGTARDPDVYVLSWHGTEGARLAPEAFSHVNEYHGHKATDVARGFGALELLLRRRFASIADGSAFTGESGHVADVVAVDGGFLVTCAAGCDLGTSAHAADEDAATARVRLHKLATEGWL
jgi:hypothetical protein